MDIVGARTLRGARLGRDSFSFMVMGLHRLGISANQSPVTGKQLIK